MPLNLGGAGAPTSLVESHPGGGAADAGCPSFLWDGAVLFSISEDGTRVAAAAQWDAAKQRARWNGRKAAGKRATVAFAESASYAGMCAAPDGANDAERADQLRFALADEPFCPVPIEDSLVLSRPGEGNRARERSEVLFAVSASKLARLAQAARSLGLKVSCAQSWAGSLAAEAFELAGRNADGGVGAAMVACEGKTWLFARRGGELQWLFSLDEDLSGPDSRSSALLGAVENFNDRVSDKRISSLAIIHCPSDKDAADALADESIRLGVMARTIEVNHSRSEMAMAMALRGSARTGSLSPADFWPQRPLDVSGVVKKLAWAAVGLAVFAGGGHYFRAHAEARAGEAAKALAASKQAIKKPEGQTPAQLRAALQAEKAQWEKQRKFEETAPMRGREALSALGKFNVEGARIDRFMLSWGPVGASIRAEGAARSRDAALAAGHSLSVLGEVGRGGSVDVGWNGAAWSFTVQDADTFLAPLAPASASGVAGAKPFAGSDMLAPKGALAQPSVGGRPPALFHSEAKP